MKKTNYMANDVPMIKVAQQECSNNKCYALAFRYIDLDYLFKPHFFKQIPQEQFTFKK